MAIKLHTARLRVTLKEADIMLGGEGNAPDKIRRMVKDGLFNGQQETEGGKITIPVDEIEHFVSLVGTPEQRAAMQREYVARKSRRN